MKTTVPIVALLHHTGTHRWHPVVFNCRPGHPRRQPPESIGHHAAGFATRQEALAAARRVAETLIYSGCASGCEIDVAADIAWDGECPIPRRENLQ
jgi:hypothetical protein